MIPIEYYGSTYYGLLSFFIILMCLPLFKYSDDHRISPPIQNFKSLIILGIVILFIGLRDPWGSHIYLGDTYNYSLMFRDINSGQVVEMKDLGFLAYMKICSQFLSHQYFYLLSALLYVLPVYSSFTKWFGVRAFYALAVYVVAMSFWSFGVNGLRNGLAASFFIYSLKFTDKKIILFLLMLLSISFHKSMVLPMLAFFSTYYLTNTKLLLKIWFSAILFSFFLGSALQSNLSLLIKSIGLGDKRSSSYFDAEIEGVVMSTGFRLDFILYSAVAVWLGYYYITKLFFLDKFYKQLFHCYLIANTVWILLIYAPYTNRTAYLSWFLMPIVMVYPLLKIQILKNQNKKIGMLILGSLFLTLALFFKE